VPGVRDVRTIGWPLMVVVGVLAGSPDLHTQSLSRSDGRWGANTPPRRPVI
jgi:hypothetical protein